MNLNTADSEAEHKYLWYTWMYHKLQLPSLWSKKKINIYYIFCTFITKGMDHLDKSISNTAMHVSNKSKTWFRDIF